MCESLDEDRSRRMCGYVCLCARQCFDPIIIQHLSVTGMMFNAALNKTDHYEEMSRKNKSTL